MTLSRKYSPKPGQSQKDASDLGKYIGAGETKTAKNIIAKGTKVGEVPYTKFVIYKVGKDFFQFADFGQRKYGHITKLTKLPANIVKEAYSTPIKEYLDTLNTEGEKAYAAAIHEMLTTGKLAENMFGLIETLNVGRSDRIRNDVTIIATNGKLDGTLAMGLNKSDIVNEDVTIVNQVGDSPGKIAGVSDNDPPLHSPKPKKIVKRKFAGTTVFEVNADVFSKCKEGHMRYERWSKYLENGDNGVSDEIRKYAKNNPKKDIIIQREGCGTMQYLRRGGTNY